MRLINQSVSRPVRLALAAVEKMGARHGEEVPADVPREHLHDQGVGHAAMIGSQQDAVALLDERAKPVGVAEFTLGHSGLLAEISGQKEIQHPGPEVAMVRRNELVGSVGDDWLHGPSDLCNKS